MSQVPQEASEYTPQIHFPNALKRRMAILHCWKCCSQHRWLPSYFHHEGCRSPILKYVLVCLNDLRCEYDKDTKYRSQCPRRITDHFDQADTSSLPQRQSTICELTFPTTVLAVRMNRKRLVVILEDQIYLYDISNMKLLYTIETSPNPNGIQHAPIVSLPTNPSQPYVRSHHPWKIAI